MIEQPTDPVLLPPPVPTQLDDADDMPPPDDQTQRWMKYGGNVLLTGVIVLVLAGIVLWAGQKYHHAADMTSDASNSLKPQTISIIKDLPGKITLVNLYPQLKEEDRKQREDTRERVQNILEQYQRNSKNIDIRAIDPIAEPAQLDAWLGDVKRKYGSNISKYEELLKTEFPKTLAEIKKLAAAESKEVETALSGLAGEQDKLTQPQIESINNTLVPARNTVRAFPTLLEGVGEGIQDEMAKKIPDYQGGVTSLRSGLGMFSRQCEALVRVLGKLRDDKDAAPAAKTYAQNAIARFEGMKKRADATLDAAKEEKLGSLKLDEVRRKLIPASDTDAPPPAIVVMGENDVRVIDSESTWKSGESTGLSGSASSQPKLRFAGEQQLTTAILALSEAKKPKIAFVRGGGPPLTNAMFGEVPFSEIGERLRNYNFDVLEKDVSGQFAQMAMQQRMPMPPEPTDEEIKDAIWVVVPTRADPRRGTMPSQELPQKLKKHLEPQSGGSDLAVDAADTRLVHSASHKFAAEEKGDTLQIRAGGAWQAGDYKVTEIRADAAVLDRAPASAGATGGAWQEAAGAALVMMDFNGDDLSGALKDFGIEAKPDKVIVHEPIDPAGDSKADDFIEQARRLPPIFVLNEYGDHPVVKPLRSLDGAFVTLVPITGRSNGDLTVTPILPIPQQPKSWGESDTSFLTGRRQQDPTFDEAAGDLAPPLYAGAIAEKKDKGRLVVIGSQQFAMDGLLRLPDPKLAKSKLNVARFPGNGELFTNSIFWLGHNEKMIALSPSAMDTARIADMSGGLLSFWRWCVFLVGPVLGIVSGVLVYTTRRA